jgi:hypothetical protein
MYYTFRAPPKSDVAGWKVVEAMVLHGLGWWPTGRPYPTRPSEVEDLARERALEQYDDARAASQDKP